MRRARHAHGPGQCCLAGQSGCRQAHKPYLGLRMQAQSGRRRRRRIHTVGHLSVFRRCPFCLRHATLQLSQNATRFHCLVSETHIELRLCVRASCLPRCASGAQWARHKICFRSAQSHPERRRLPVHHHQARIRGGRPASLKRPRRHGSRRHETCRQHRRTPPGSAIRPQGSFP